MRWVVFLRAANVGKHNRFKPGNLVKNLPKFGLINIGAVGTFVVSENVTEAKVRAAVASKLPFKCEIMIRSATEILDLAARNPLTDNTSDQDRRVFLTVMSKPLSASARKRLSLPVHAPNKEKWEVKIVRIDGACVLSEWRRLRQNPLYPNQVIEKQFGVATTTRTWGTIAKVVKILAREQDD